MKTTLDVLSNNEYVLYNEVVCQSGDLEYLKDVSSQFPVIFQDYKALHSEYLNLYNQSDNDAIKTEALKRLVFLNWSYALEPNWLTNINELDNNTMFNAYEILNDLLKTDKLDDEFIWMLSFYSSWDFIILHFSDDKLPELTSFVKEVDNTIRHCPKKSIIDATMENRGQMGIYWKSITK
jgi:hypothetical protein